MLDQYHLANEDIHPRGNIPECGTTDVVSELRSRNTDHLDSREVNDLVCKALAILRDESLLNPARNSRKSNTRKPCRRDGHDTKTGKSPERSSNLTDDRVSSDDGPDSSDPKTSAKGMDAEQIVSPVTLNRRSTRLSSLQPGNRKHETHKQEKRSLPCQVWGGGGGG